MKISRSKNKIKIEFDSESNIESNIIANIQIDLGIPFNNRFVNHIEIDDTLSKDFISYLELNPAYKEYFNSDELESIVKIENEKSIILDNHLKDKKKEFSDWKDDEGFISFIEKVKENINIDFEDELFGSISKKQASAVYSMSKLENTMNFSQPGAGKTLMTLMNLVRIVKDKEKVIIVSPKNSMNVWYDEIKKFLKWIPNKKLVHFYNEEMHRLFSDRKEKKITDFKYAKFILVNYESIKNITDHDLLMDFLSQEGFHIVFDEVHRIKSEKSIRNKHSKELSKKAISRTVMTGTPFSKTIGEIKELIDIAWPNGNEFISKQKLEEFTDDFDLNEMEIDGQDFYIPEQMSENIDNLSKMMEPLYFSLSKINDFGILPENDLYENPTIVKPLEIQVKLNDFLRKEISVMSSLLHNNKHNIKKYNEILEKYHALFSYSQMNIVNPFLLSDNLKFKRFFEECDEIPFEKLPKIASALEKVKDLVNNDKKVLVWFTYVKNIKGFKKLLIKNNIKAEIIHGETPGEERKKIIDSFANPKSNIQVLISNPATIAESISLHKSVSNSIFVERTMSYFQWAQAKDRIHRVGSKEQVSHHYIKNDESISFEKLLFENLKKKDIVSKMIISNENIMDSWKNSIELRRMEDNDRDQFGLDDINELLGL